MPGHPAKQITDVYDLDGKWAFNVDFLHDEFLVTWKGTWLQPPHLENFPRSAEDDGATVERIAHSDAVKTLWQSSQPLKHGSDAHIRLLDQCADDFPICKVAITARQRELIRDEFAIMQHLSKSATAHGRVVKIATSPLQDDEGVFGYRMEKLTGLSLEEIGDYEDEIRNGLEDIHAAGVTHQDFSWTNIMRHGDGSIKFIDFGHAGFSGQPIPGIKSRRKSQTQADYTPLLDSNTLQVWLE